MRGAILLSIAAVFCCLAGVSEATTCKAATASTCEASLFMTGQCVRSVCECKATYTAGPFGCQKKQKPTLTADFNGELQVGATGTLTCSAGIGTATYKWFKDTVDTTKTGATFALTTAALTMGGSYTCQSEFDGILFDKSDPFKVTVAATFPTPLEVTGMPTKAVDGTKVTFTCKTLPKYKASTFTWALDGTKIAGSPATQTYAHAIQASDAGKKLKCTLTDATDSAEVAFPDSFETDIDGVEINAISSTSLLVGEKLVLECKQKGGFPDVGPSDPKIKYEWKKDGNAMTPPKKTNPKLEITTVAVGDSGVYTCESTAGGTAKKSTPVTVTVTVKKTPTKVPKISSSNTPLAKGYFSLTCDYPNTKSYVWFKDTVELKGVTDQTLQFNEAGSDSNGDYKCQTTTNGGTVTSAVFKVTADPSTVITSDTPTMIDAPKVVEVGKAVTLTCKNGKYYTPGMTYTWTVGGKPHTGNAKTLQYTPKDKTQVTITCAYKFDGQTSNPQSTKITATYIVEVNIKINDVIMTALKPVTGSKVKLTCDVKKADGAGAVTYVWKDGATAVKGQTSEVYVLVASSTTSITCEATANTETKASPAVSVTPQATPEKPTVKIVPQDNVSRKTKVVMTCMSDSHAEEATFEWYKDGKAIEDVSSAKHEINKVVKADDGKYTCKITVSGKTSAVSDPEELKTAEVKTCTAATDCDGPNMDTTTCTKGKCQCLKGYTMEEGICSGAVAVMGSLLMIVCAVLGHRMF